MSKINFSLREINLLFESLEKLRMYYRDTVTDREIMELIRKLAILLNKHLEENN